MASENTIYFYPGRGGHSHDGENSSFIDTSKYSLFDFSWGRFGDPDRRRSQDINYFGFENFIIETVNKAVLKPAGLILQPGTVNGDSDIISNSISTKLIAADAITADQILAGTITADEIAAGTITATQIATNTITATQIAAGAITASEIAAGTITATQIATDTITATQIATDTITANEIAAGAITASEIAAGTITATQIAAGTITATQIAAGAITADELSANIVLVNNVILSNNYVTGVSGWAIDGDGTAEFANTSIRGTVQAGSLTTPGLIIAANGDLTSGGGATVLYADGSIVTSSGNFGVDTAGNLYANNATITGILSAESGSRIGNFYFNAYGLTNGSSSGSLGDINLDTFNNIIYTPWLRASNGADRTDVRLGYIEMDRYGAGGPAQIRFNRERNGANERYLAFALAGYEGGVIGSINQASASTVNYLTSSDSRLKINVDKPYDALVVINTLMPRLYKWRLDDEDGEHLGFFAQELYEVYPDAVGVGVDALEQDIDLVKENPWGIDYSKIVPLLTKAIQELCIKVEVLEQKVVELESN